MDDQNENPRTFSYPNSDRPLPSSESTPAPKPIVHLQDALTQTSELNTGTTRNIKTFQSDVANAVKQDNVSMIKIALAEKKRQDKQGTYEDIAVTSQGSKVLIVSVVAFVALLVIVGSFFIFFNQSTKKETPQTVVQSKAQLNIFDAEEQIPFDVEGRDLTTIESFVQKQKTVKIELGSIQQIEFIAKNTTGVSADITSREFLNVISARVPDMLLRALKDDFMFGIYSLTPRDSFAIFKIDSNSYDNAYAGMLAWELYLEDDLGGLIINKIPQATPDDVFNATGTNSFRRKPFVDRVVQNKDARVLLSDTGKIRLLYTFFDESTIIVASSESMLKELSVRLTTGRIVR
ncbi:MAG: hypothetical protein RL094_145 [Candidatus Parcubacteria bacterium]|jgi:cytochrome c oxidase assembly protein Cox11